jgi:hypothetical protein
MPTSTAQKLKIKDGYTLLAINAPAEFKKNIGELPKGVKIVSGGKDYNQVHWFVANKTQMDKEVDKILKFIKDDVVLWIYYPKGSSKIQTDLTRDKGWDKLFKKD